MVQKKVTAWHDTLIFIVTYCLTPSYTCHPLPVEDNFILTSQRGLTMTTPTLNAQQERFIRIKEVTHLTGIPRPTVYYMMEKGLFPKQISLSGKSVAWQLSSVLAFMQERIAASTV